MPVVTAYHGTISGDFEKFNLEFVGTGAKTGQKPEFGKAFSFYLDKEEALEFTNELHGKGWLASEPYLYTVKIKFEKQLDLIVNTYCEQDLIDDIFESSRNVTDQFKIPVLLKTHGYKVMQLGNEIYVYDTDIIQIEERTQLLTNEQVRLSQLEEISNRIKAEQKQRGIK